MSIIYAALGGALGAAVRFGVGRLVVFPLGTLTVNVLGSFLMGVLFVALMSAHPRTLAFAMTGILGGFTTFSAFSLDAFRLAEAGHWFAAAAYTGGTVVLSLVAVALGVALARGCWV